MLHDEVTPSIRPGDDFYRFVNQKWLDTHPIPADKSRYAAFTVLDDETTERLRELLERPLADDDSHNTRLAKQFYQAAMDEAAVEKDSDQQVRAVAERVREISHPADIVRFVASAHGNGQKQLWRPILDVDDKDSSRMIMRFEQGGLGLPDRDYYFESGEKFEAVRQAYRSFLTALFDMMGLTDSASRAAHVWEIELSLAEASSTAVEQRDVDARYNKIPIGKLAESFPGFDWETYLELSGLERADAIVVSHLPFVSRAIQLMQTVDATVWADYLLAQTMIPRMMLLSRSYADLYMSFYGKTLSGAEQREARYKEVIRRAVSLLPDPLGEVYVRTYFDESAKRAMYDLVDRLQEALRRRIEKLDWMGEQTKQRALEKLETFLPLLGYPDTWRDYSELVLGEQYAVNYQAVVANEWRYDLSRLGATSDRHEWVTSPAVVNAFYWPNMNSITFPAAILQPPFFDAVGDFAANYGGIGAVIGHEITHGFDDTGSKYDETGNLVSWWSDDDRAEFDARAKQLEKQFDTYEVDGERVKGALTLGENIADLGGMLIAYDALRTLLDEQPELRVPRDGFTPEQRFFMAQARVWRTNIRPELALRFVMSDTHAPAEFRVNGVVPNIDGFYEAFDVRPGVALYTEPTRRVRIW